LTERELVKEAIRRAGTQQALAEHFRISQSAISEWGRTRPIPRHVKRSLEEFIGLKASAAPEVQGKVLRSLAQKIASSRFTQDVERLLDVLISRGLADLPHRYRRRYEDRVRELLTHVGRELEEYGRLLDVEYRANLSRKRSVRHPPPS
jgi:hypothetical protein